MHGLEASFGLADNSIEVGGNPINGADDFVRVEDYAFDDSNVHDANTCPTFAEEAFDGDAVTNGDLSGLLVLAAFFPTKHPNAFADERCILMVCTTPGSSDQPVF